MNRIRRLVGPVLVSVFAVLAGLALLPMRAGAAGESLSLEPREGPPNTSVGWVAEGFTKCPPVDDVNSEGVVVLRWDGKDELGRATASADDGSAASTFLVPETATLDVHRVTATCLGDSGMSASSEFNVTPPVVVPVLVPNVIGSPEDKARANLEDEKFPVEVIGVGDVVVRQLPPGGTSVDPGTLVTIELGESKPETTTVPFLIGLRLKAAREAIRDADLVLGGVSGDRTGLVTDQSPGAGGEVLKGAAVSISLAEDTTVTVLVPNVVGQPLEGVPGILVGKGLTLGLVTGKPDPEGVDLVVSQQPPAGSEVPQNSQVNVSVEGVPPKLVKVPSVVGNDAADARAALAKVGLLPVGSEESDGEVSEQQPAAGTLMPLGSPVSLVVEPQKSAAGLVVGLVLVGAAALAARGPLSRSLDRRWVRTHLDIRPGTRAQEAADVDTEMAGSAPTRAVRIVPRYDPGTHVLHEEER